MTATPRITTAALAEQVAGLAAGQASIVELLAKLTPQFSTPGAVAESVVETPAKPKRTPKAKAEPVIVEPVVPAKTQSDIAREFVTSKGLAFARGGRTTGNIEVAQAIVRVLKTGSPEVVTLSGLGSLDKRHITAVCIFPTDAGNGFNTQYLFQPEAAE